MKYYVQIFVYFVLPHLPFIGSEPVTIDFNSIGYIGESTVLKCQDTHPITADRATWYHGDSLVDLSSSRYTQTTTPTGFNLTISSLVTADEGEYRCIIDFAISIPKSLNIYYNTKAVNVTKLYPHAIEITFIAFPDPVYVATVKQDGVQLDVYWNVYKSIQASGAIMFLLRNSTVFTNPTKVYTVHVNITFPVSLDVEINITWVSDLTAERFDGCAPEDILGLALGVGLGNDIIYIICLILIVIFVKKGATDPKNTCSREFILRLGFSIICVSCIACLIILVMIAKSCVLKLELGLGLGLGIPFLGCITVIVILVKKEANIQNKDDFQHYIVESLEMSITAFIHGLYIQRVQWYGPDGNILTSNGKYNIKYDRASGISTLQILALERNDSGFYTCCSIGIFGSSAKDTVYIEVYAIAPAQEPGIRRIKSLPLPIHMLLQIQKLLLQPTSPENSDVEDQNLRGINVSANIDDSQGLPTYIHRSRSCPLLTEKQPTVEKEDTSEKPKNKTNKKKKGKVNEGNSEEMVELNRKLPEGQSDED